MKPVSTMAAKAIQREHDADCAIVIVMDQFPGRYAAASYGRDKKLCASVGEVMRVFCDMIESGKVGIE